MSEKSWEMDFANDKFSCWPQIMVDRKDNKY